MGSSLSASVTTASFPPFFPSGPAPIVRVMVQGDSLAESARARRELARALEPYFPGLVFVGDRGLGLATGGIIGSQDLQSWAHSGVGGDTIAAVLARVPSTLAVVPAVDLLIDVTSTNDISQLRTLGQIEADKRALWEAQIQAWPTARIIVPAPPIWRSGSASGGTWAQKQALRDQVVAALPGWVSSYGGRVLFVDAYAGQPPQEISSDGVHPGLECHGFRRWAHRTTDKILALAGLRRHVRTVPAKREPQAAIVFSDPANDRIFWTGTAALCPEDQSFAFTCWWRPTDVATATPRSIAGMGITSSAGWTLVQVGNGLSFYLAHGSAAIAGDGGGYSDGILEAGQSYHLAVVADRAANAVGLAVNGRVVYHARDLVAAGYPGASWNLSPDYFFLGKLPLDGAPGTMKEAAFYKGSAAPSIRDLPAFAYQTYQDGIFWGGLSALFRLDEGSGLPTEAAGVVPTPTVVGATWGSW